MKVSDELDNVYIRLSMLKVDLGALRRRDDLREAITDVENCIDEALESVDEASKVAKERGL